MDRRIAGSQISAPGISAWIKSSRKYNNTWLVNDSDEMYASLGGRPVHAHQPIMILMNCVTFEFSFSGSPDRRHMHLI